MDVLYRLKFHTKMKIQSIKNWLEETFLHKTDEEILAKYNAVVDSLSQEEKHKIEQLVMEDSEAREANRPPLNPRRTMLIHSRPEEHYCTSVTAPLYRHRILNAVEWAQERGITVFMADYCTPLGLLALETLVELREEEADFHVYAVKSCYIGQRRTYRTIPETGTEMVFLPARADYCFRDSLEKCIEKSCQMHGFIVPNAAFGWPKIRSHLICWKHGTADNTMHSFAQA